VIEVFNGLITSKMRVRLLMRLFLNPHTQSYIRGLAQDFDVSPSQVKQELDNLKSSGLLNSEKNGRQVFYQANQQHPLFPELQSMVHKSLGMDRIVDSILERLGNLEAAYVVGDYAAGRDSGIVDIVLLGNIDLDSLADLTQKTERYIDRRIRTLVVQPEEFEQLANQDALKPRLLLWGDDL
jgi:hypothetical protein